MSLRTEIIRLEPPKIEYEAIGKDLINPFVGSVIHALSEAQRDTQLVWQIAFQRQKIRDLKKVKEASAVAERIFEKLLSTYGKIQYNSAELIRKWRDAGWTTS
ncbi:MAG: hypothetical protein QW270_01620 [Candidatus Bathyarchaeia archaeon]